MDVLLILINGIYILPDGFNYSTSIALSFWLTYKCLLFWLYVPKQTGFFLISLSFLQKFNKSGGYNKIRGKFPISFLSGNSRKEG
jgi:hypothetical protein